MRRPVALRYVDALLSGPRRALQLGLSARAGTRARGVKHVPEVCARRYARAMCEARARSVSARARARETHKAVANS